MALLAVGGAVALDVLLAVELGHDAIIAGDRSRLGGTKTASCADPTASVCGPGCTEKRTRRGGASELDFSR